MNKLLIKLFVKNHEDIENSVVRSAYGMLAGVSGLSVNILLFICKLIVGLLSKSIAVVADSFNNLSDAGSFFISVLASILSKKPADKEHPFGHERIEYIAGLLISFIIMNAGFTLLMNSIKRISEPEIMVFEWAFIIILLVSMLFKAWVMLLNRDIGIRINSYVQKAAFLDSRNDLIVTGLTIVSMLIAKYFNFSIDSFVGIGVSVFVFISGIKIAKGTLMPLLGSAADKKLYEKITSKVESYKGIIGSHDLIVHNYGPSNIMATIHAQVPNNMDMQKVHDVIDKIERDVYKEMGIHLVIHMDPQEVNDIRFFIYKSLLIDIVKRLDSNASIHDFHAKFKNQQIKLDFDVTVPHSYSEQQENALSENIQKELIKSNPAIKCDITIEHGFIDEE
ncbi:MAG TPA: cation diffusion facilitator family transporter [Clostridia bacterium]|nr:MAG: Ferrous-iron efflux pump FieF [Firmicutes bacterium ADurb.Bin146]HOD92305.1 cation diffusion facilitator family transporter [Clostridia bacterium]HQM38698.1 cation diffusion facilitator family transporter [Clostridia bacterium]